MCLSSFSDFKRRFARREGLGMLSRKIAKKEVAGIFAMALLATASLLSAHVGVEVGVGIHEHHHYWHEHPHWGLHVTCLPDGYHTIYVGDRKFFYHEGLYYTVIPGGYELVEPPMGGCVSVIPSDFLPVIINGVTYYTDNGIYYILTKNGYQVVAPPSAQPSPAVVSQPEATGSTPLPAPSAPVASDSFKVNVPNDKGGYVEVVIKKGEKGYLGPQGEFYPEFPDIAQLKAMYAK